MEITMTLDMGMLASAVQRLMAEWNSEPDELEAVTEEIVGPIFYYQADALNDDLYWDVVEAVVDRVRGCEVRRKEHVWHG